jgi:transcriptional regulator of aromatic amino acid metabolism
MEGVDAANGRMNETGCAALVFSGNGAGKDILTCNCKYLVNRNDSLLLAMTAPCSPDCQASGLSSSHYGTSTFDVEGERTAIMRTADQG